MKYYIPKYHLEKLEKLVKSLQKKTNVKFEVFEDDTKVETFVDHCQPDHPEYRYLTIAVELEIDYKVGDYELVAELEHTGAGNIIRQINYDIEVPTTYRDVPCKCEHCNTARKRSNTFLLVDKNNNFKQVGKNCLNEYTGIDTVFILNKVSSINFLLREDLENNEEFIEWLRGGNEPNYEPLDVMANLFYQIVLEDGYSKESTNPFKHLNELKYREDLEDKVNEILNVINTDWYNDNSNYCYNVKVVLNLGYIEPKHWRLLLSYINSAMIYLNKQIQKQLEKEGLNNDYLGNVGDRVEFEVKSIKVLWTTENTYHYNRYNDNVIFTYRILTNTNSVIIWNTEQLVEVGMKIKATIKDLKVYKDEKQTIITRGKVLTTKKVEQPKVELTNCGKPYCKAIERAQFDNWFGDF